MTNGESLIDLAGRAYHWLEDGLLSRLGEAGWSDITPSQRSVLPRLDAGGTRPSELARRLGVTRQAAHQTIQELVELGLVELAPDPTSRRAKLVVPSRRGKRLIAEAAVIVRDLESTLEGRIGRKRVARLRRALEEDWGSPGPPTVLATGTTGRHHARR